MMIWAAWVLVFTTVVAIMSPAVAMLRPDNQLTDSDINVLLPVVVLQVIAALVLGFGTLL